MMHMAGDADDQAKASHICYPDGLRAIFSVYAALLHTIIMAYLVNFISELAVHYAKPIYQEFPL